MNAMPKLFNFLLILANVALAVSGQVAIKYGMQKVGVITASNTVQMLMKSFTNIFVLLGLFAYALAAVTWILVLSRVELSFAYPMLSIGYIAILIISALFLHEAVSVWRIAGTLLILSGIVLVFRS